MKLRGCSNCGGEVWRPGLAWVHWATGRASCDTGCADAAPSPLSP